LASFGQREKGSHFRGEWTGAVEKAARNPAAVVGQPMAPSAKKRLSRKFRSAARLRPKSESGQNHLNVKKRKTNKWPVTAAKMNGSLPTPLLRSAPHPRQPLRVPAAQKMEKGGGDEWSVKADHKNRSFLGFFHIGVRKKREIRKERKNGFAEKNLLLPIFFTFTFFVLFSPK
jgi:hypothetical protein